MQDGLHWTPAERTLDAGGGPCPNTNKAEVVQTRHGFPEIGNGAHAYGAGIIRSVGGAATAR